MFKRILVAVAGTAAILPATAVASFHVAHYKGKTKEGTKISFVVDRIWVDQFSTLLPTTCVSAQGGTPNVDFTEWQIPYKYRLGVAAKVDYGDPTKHYHITTHRGKGGRVTGKLQINYSLLGSDTFGDYMLWECLATANFNLRPR